MSRWHKSASGRAAWMGRAGLGVLAALVISSGCDDPKVRGRSRSSWIHSLASKDAHERRMACEALADLGPEAAPAVEPLVEILEKDPDGVQLFAEVALRKIGAAAVAPLEGVLQRPEPDVRMHAAAALLGIESAHAEAAKVLGQAATGLGNAELAAYAQDAVVRLGEAGVPILLPYLDDPYEPVRRQVIAVLAKMGARGRPAMEKLASIVKASAEKAEIRIEAMKAWAAMATAEEGSALLRTLLEDPAPGVADHAGAMLQYLGVRQSASGNEAPAGAPAEARAQ